MMAFDVLIRFDSETLDPIPVKMGGIPRAGDVVHFDRAHLPYDYAQFTGPMIVVGECTWILDPNGSGMFIPTIRVASARRSRPAPMRVSTN